MLEISSHKKPTSIHKTAKVLPTKTTQLRTRCFCYSDVSVIQIPTVLQRCFVLFDRAEFLNRQKLLECLIQQNSNADLVFVIDCTGSMASYIENTKLQISNIVSACIEEFENKVTFFALLAQLLAFK